MKNERIAKGFNKLAPLYTTLSRLVFGKKLERAQEYFLLTIKPGDSVLILGGGSGNLLQNLIKQQPQTRIDYVDVSEKMIELARRKTKNLSTVRFIIGTEEDIPAQEYSIVITNFYLDLFSDKTLQYVLQKIRFNVKPDGQWLATDFVAEKYWHKIMLWIMYRFFRLTTGIEARKLPDWQNQLTQAGLTEADSKDFFGGFIKTSRYTKA